jgi:squalene cyclase
VRLVAALAVSAALATPAQFLHARQAPDGGFAEAGGQPGPALTAWAAVGLVAAGQDPGAALDYLRAHEQEVTSPITRTLIAFAEAALGDPNLAAALPLAPTQTNTIAWTILARRQAGLSVPKQLVTTLLVRQAKNGGWGWGKGVAPDSNDTAAAVEALRAAGVSGKPIRRALAYLATLRRPDGGFALGSTGASDAQSTAWAIQAYLAAGKQSPKRALAYLARMRQADGSYRFSQRYAVTPVWVTAQVLPAVAKRPFPFGRG